MIKKVKQVCICIFLVIILSLANLLFQVLIMYSTTYIHYTRGNSKDGFYQLNFMSIENLNEESIINKILLIKPFDFVTGNIHIRNSKNISYQIGNNLICLKKDYEKQLPSVLFGNCKSEVIFETKEEEQIYIIPKTGIYKIELWGASGGNSYAFAKRYKKAGNGAYTAGEIKLKKGEILYFQVGSKGEDSKIIKDDERLTIFYYPSRGGTGGYNGGGTGADDPQTDAGGGGGGATDVRLISGEWNDFESLKSRIMVAAGAGGMSRHLNVEGELSNRGDSGSGGTITGIDAKKLFDANSSYGHGATQTTGYKFGIGQTGIYCKTSLNGLGGGAGGYFGSLSGSCGIEKFEMPTGAGGGSSYVSGCKGCKAIEESSTENKITFSDKSTHYSSKKFTNIVMKSGDEKMPTPSGGTMTGNKGNGIAKISFIK